MSIAPDRLIVEHRLAAIRLKDGAQNRLFYALKNHFFKEDPIEGGAIFAAITNKDLHHVPLLRPTNQLTKQFKESLVPVDRQIETLGRANATPWQARDHLLPRLLSGKVVA